MQPDCWVLSFADAEHRLLQGGHRRRCLSMLKTLRERHLEPCAPAVGVELLRTLLLFECEKHPADADWSEACLPYRLSGVLLQLIACLQSRACGHYLLGRLDLLGGQPTGDLESAARLCWCLARELLTNACSLDHL